LTGSEHQEQLWQRIRQRGIPYLGWREVDELIEKILQGKIDYRLASESWGLRDVSLPEVSVNNRSFSKPAIIPDQMPEGSTPDLLLSF
jgi:hypothetical protein